jgi:hypothetical protein
MTLNLESFDDKSKKKSKTKYKAALGVGSAVSLFGIGSTLAANITLNNDQNVEFGQGVVTTAACDEDGFTITPVTYFDNQEEVFKVEHVLVSGVNLNTEGKNWDDPDLNSTYADQAAAKAAHPGQYYDTDANSWKNTCDGVVLDFKAYTDDSLYVDRTVITGDGAGSLQNPIGWYQEPRSWDSPQNRYPGFALVIDVSDDGYFGGEGPESSYKNWAVDVYSSDGPEDMTFQGVDFQRGDSSNSSFKFYVEDALYKTDPASISKITVQSMSEFPASYYARYSGLGNPTWIMT